MALTVDFKETVVERAQRDSAYRRGLLTRGIAFLLAADDDEDLHVGKSLIRDYINATIGFPALARRTHIPSESLMRMLSPKGNPSLSNLNAIIHTLLAEEGLRRPGRLRIELETA